MNLVVAGTEAAVLMVESEAQNLSEEIMLGGVMFGHEQMQAAINAIHDLVAEAGKPEWDRSEEHTSELQSLMRISYAVFCLKKKTQSNYIQQTKQANI